MRAKILLISIICLAFLLRVFKIGEVPATLYGDEQAFAWNAYNILKLGEDEYGNSYPLQFRSFEDYKAPIPVYLLVPFIKILGLNAFAIRLPIVLASVFTVMATYFLARLFLNKKISLFTTFLLAVSPWHMHLSRGYFEATLALLWFVAGVYFFLISVSDSSTPGEPLGVKPRNEPLRDHSRCVFRMLLSMFFFALSLYSYFTPRILVPIFLGFLFWYDRVFTRFLHLGGVMASSVSRRIQPATVRGVFTPGHPRGVYKAYLLAFLFLIILSLPLIKLTFFERGFSRLDKLLETNNRIVIETVNKERSASNLSNIWKVVLHNKATVWFRLIKNNYLEHLSLNFWYIYGDNSLRYFTGNMGMFYLLEFPFLILGLYFLWQEKRNAAIFFLGWLLLAPIPAAIVGRSFAVRSLAMLPAPFIFVGYGIYKLMFIISNSSTSGESSCTPPRCLYRFLFPAILVFGFAFSLGSLLIRYYFEYKVYAATWWGWENKTAIDYAKEREDQFDYIFISDFYTGSTLAYAIYTKYDPLGYRQAIHNPVVMADGRHLIKLGKYHFGSLDVDSKRLKNGIIPPKSLYLARPEEADSGETINAPDDGRIIFKIYKTDESGRLLNL